VVDTASPLSGNDRHRPKGTDSDLQIVIGAWAKLPKPIQAGIVTMIKAAT
jgi:hypothetical protein